MPDGDLLVWPFTAGLLAAFNPCGFAMLPTYLTYFLGLDEGEETSMARSVLRGGKVGLALTFGFLTVFAVFGLLFEVILSGDASNTVQGWLWILTMVSGIAILGLGAAMLRGYQPTLNLPKLQMGTGSREIGSMYLFGVSYGIVSIGCTISLFLLVITSALADTDVAFGALYAFGAYALGMGSVIVFLTMALAAGRTSVANRMRSLLPKINRVSGGLLVLAGIYLTNYGWFQRDPINNGNAFIDRVEGWQSWIVSFIENDLGTERAGQFMLWASIVIAALAVGWTLVSRRRRRGDDSAIEVDADETPESETPPAPTPVDTNV